MSAKDNEGDEMRSSTQSITSLTESVIQYMNDGLVLATKSVTETLYFNQSAIDRINTTLTTIVFAATTSSIISLLRELYKILSLILLFQNIDNKEVKAARLCIIASFIVGLPYFITMAEYNMVRKFFVIPTTFSRLMSDRMTRPILLRAIYDFNEEWNIVSLYLGVPYNLLFIVGLVFILLFDVKTKRSDNGLTVVLVVTIFDLFSLLSEGKDALLRRALRKLWEPLSPQTTTLYQRCLVYIMSPFKFLLPDPSISLSQVLERMENELPPCPSVEKYFFKNYHLNLKSNRMKKKYCNRFWDPVKSEKVFRANNDIIERKAPKGINIKTPNGFITIAGMIYMNLIQTRDALYYDDETYGVLWASIR
jgi:hypothetical protein